MSMAGWPWDSLFSCPFSAICYYCCSNNSRTVRRISCTCCERFGGMGEHSFPKVFPLAVFTLRAIWYIRYILKTDLNLMIPDVVIWQPIDRVKQIRIPHPGNEAPLDVVLRIAAHSRTIDILTAVTLTWSYCTGTAQCIFTFLAATFYIWLYSVAWTVSSQVTRYQNCSSNINNHICSPIHII